MESRNLRRKDTTRGPPLRVLSLDGGGIRGFSMLIILQELMHRTYVECEGKAPKRDEIPKPCDHFDLIAGTGTGGLIALMLGRLRLDIETCMKVYIDMTRYVFQTDKTIAGIPYRSTLFKASKLEEAIRQCVLEHTSLRSEGNDGSPSPTRDFMSSSQVGGFSNDRQSQRRLTRGSISGASITGTSPSNPVDNVRGSMVMNGSIYGNPDAPLYDNREDRTKTAVAAVYKGTPKHGSAVLLRSYDSRKEPPPEFNCTIWQAGRATSATALAFKPIQIGQHVFLDEGAGKYNPAPLVLDEAVVNEWPGRELGVFVSVGTGKRPPDSSHLAHEWWEDVFKDSLGNFAEARRRLIGKIEGCEETHHHMMREHLDKRGVAKENYYRLNVEVGVGEFGMNEWNRLAEIGTNTKLYLKKDRVERMTQDAAVKLAKIKRMHQRLARPPTQPAPAPASAPAQTPAAQVQDYSHRPVPPLPTANPAPRPATQPPLPPPRVAFELPADEGSRPASRGRLSQGPPAHGHSPSRSDGGSIDPSISTTSFQHEHILGLSPPGSPRLSGIARRSSDTFPSGAPLPPPVPPKTPIPFPSNRPSGPAAELDTVPIPPRSPNRPERTVPFNINGGTTNNNFSKTSNGQAYPSRSRIVLPYPDDEPPPIVNRMRKPTYSVT